MSNPFKSLRKRVGAVDCVTRVGYNVKSPIGGC